MDGDRLVPSIDAGRDGFLTMLHRNIGYCFRINGVEMQLEAVEDDYASGLSFDPATGDWDGSIVRVNFEDDEPILAVFI
jgi:hypothetical protein